MLTPRRRIYFAQLPVDNFVHELHRQLGFALNYLILRRAIFKRINRDDRSIKKVEMQAIDSCCYPHNLWMNLWVIYGHPSGAMRDQSVAGLVEKTA